MQAVGALLDAYRAGYFPMADPRTHRLEWFNPDPRAVIPLDAFHVPRSLERVTRRLTFTSDRDFVGVMRACAEPRPDQPDSWIDERLIAVYAEVHRAGAAHSIEAWLDSTLVGGVYGVSIGAAFFAESMFHRAQAGGTSAGNAALVRLLRHTRDLGYALFDTQILNPHTARFGCVEVPRDEYLNGLADAIARADAWTPLC